MSNKTNQINFGFKSVWAPVFFFGTIVLIITLISLNSQKNSQYATELISGKKDIVNTIQRYDDYFLNNYFGATSNLVELKEDLQAARTTLQDKSKSLPVYPNDEVSAAYRQNVNGIIKLKIESYELIESNIKDQEKVGEIKSLLNEQDSNLVSVSDKLNEIALAYKNIVDYYIRINSTAKAESWKESSDKVLLVNDQLKTGKINYEQAKNTLIEYFTLSDKGEIYPPEVLSGYEITPLALRINDVNSAITKLESDEKEIKTKYNL